jgi:hypothetical protein
VPFTELGRIQAQGLKDLGFTRPTPIQADAIPLAMAGQDLLAVRPAAERRRRFSCRSSTDHRQAALDDARARADPDAELAAQIVEDLNDLPSTRR